MFQNTEALLHLQLIGFSVFLSLLSLFCGYKLGFFVSPTSESPIMPLKNMLQVFLLFICLQFFILPVIGHFWLVFEGLTFPLAYDVQGWLNVIGIVLLSIAVGSYTLYKWSNVYRLFKSAHFLKDVLLGVTAWFVAYPCILLISHVMTLIIHDILGFPMEEQLAVKQIKLVLNHPFLLGATIFAVVGIVPIIEELLFRGYLQGACKIFFSKKVSILLSGLCFTAFHFALSQGINNITILSSLFVLACFLGFLRERQGNLFASITLHMVFNAVSISLILAQD